MRDGSKNTNVPDDLSELSVSSEFLFGKTSFIIVNSKTNRLEVLLRDVLIRNGTIPPFNDAPRISIIHRKK